MSDGTRVLMIGLDGAGKTCLLQRLVSHTSVYDYGRDPYRDSCRNLDMRQETERQTRFNQLLIASNSDTRQAADALAAQGLQPSLPPTIPTIGFNVESMDFTERLDAARTGAVAEAPRVLSVCL